MARQAGLKNCRVLAKPDTPAPGDQFQHRGRTIVVKPTAAPQPKQRLERKPRPRPKSGEQERKQKVPAWIAGWKPEPQIAHWARGSYADVVKAQAEAQGEAKEWRDWGDFER